MRSTACIIRSLSEATHVYDPELLLEAMQLNHEKGSDGVLHIATSLLHVPAEIIALIYQYRWTIEIFFRFFAS